MRGDRGYAKAILLGGVATGAALCACLTLFGFAFFIIAILNIDDDRAAGPSGYYSASLLASAAFSLLVAARFGWRVGWDRHRHWYNERVRLQGPKDEP